MLNHPFENRDWQIIAETPLAPPVNVALDEVLLHECTGGARRPLLRFWEWAAPAVVIGRFQSLGNEVDRTAAAEMGVGIVRRVTGGGAMFVEPGRGISYSLYFPEDWVNRLSIVASYEVCDRWAVQALQKLGVPAYYRPVNDIACDDGKIGGAAQARRNGFILHHTTIAYDMNAADLLRVLRLGRERPSDRGTPSAPKRVSPLARHLQQSRNEVCTALANEFASQFGGEQRELEPRTLQQAVLLAESKFATEDWTAALF